MDNKFELVFNERDDAAELKNLPIDDTMHGIIEEEELEDEVSDEENEAEADWAWNRRSLWSAFRSKRVCVFCLQIASLPPILKLHLKHCLFEKSNLIISEATYSQIIELP